MKATLCRLAVMLSVPLVFRRAPARPTSRPPATYPPRIGSRSSTRATSTRASRATRRPRGSRSRSSAEAPVVVNPVGMTFADDGTPYVLEWRPRRRSRRRARLQDGDLHLQGRDQYAVIGRSQGVHEAVKELSDSTGQGVYDEAKVVLEDELPSSILLHDGWLYVAGRGTGAPLQAEQGEGGPFDVKEVGRAGLLRLPLPPRCRGMSIGPDGWLYLSRPATATTSSKAPTAAGPRCCAPAPCSAAGRTARRWQTYAIGFCNPVRRRVVRCSRQPVPGGQRRLRRKAASSPTAG